MRRQIEAQLKKQQEEMLTMNQKGSKLTQDNNNKQTPTQPRRSSTLK
jgi:hypothetical protein